MRYLVLQHRSSVTVLADAVLAVAVLAAAVLAAAVPPLSQGRLGGV